MNSNLHPIMAAALAPFVNPPLRHLRREPPMQCYRYTLNGVDLDCVLEFEKGDKATRDEPGWPDTAILWTAKTASGDDVTEILGDDQRAEIEEAFLNQTEEF